MDDAADEARRVIASDATVSDKIRALDRAGYPRAEIARLLGKRYQHVRNVLEADRLQTPARASKPAAPPAAPGFEEPKTPDLIRETPSSGIFRLPVRADGSIVIPAAVCAALNVGPGDALVGELRGKDFSLTDILTSAQRVQEMFLKMNLGAGLVDELIADRRREAAREESNG